MNSRAVSVLGRSDVIALLGLNECMDAVERAFAAHAEGRSLGPGVLGIHSADGGFHIKAAGLELGKPYFATKVNGNFFHNRERFDLPNIQGRLILCDAKNGSPLAVMDSIEITILRTGAATGVAAKHLSREDASVVTVCGCGNQGEVSLRAIAQVRDLTKVFAFDSDDARASLYSQTMSDELGINVAVAHELSEATSASDIIVTCTPSSTPFLERSMVTPGTFIAAVGADSDMKQELHGDLIAA